MSTEPDIVERLRDIAAWKPEGVEGEGFDECAAAADEIERLRANWTDLRLRLVQARQTLMAMAAQTHEYGRLDGKRQGIDVALDYMRGYDPGGDRP